MKTDKLQVKAAIDWATVTSLEAEIISKMMPKDVPPYFVNQTRTILDFLPKTPVEKRRRLETLKPINAAIIEIYNHWLAI